ncbi:hypothetical protein LTR49_025793 [Elasticomyces elasticus]|nr:hypothetical protein LTR49_025793 [Elasticomyces elasticus]
MAVQDQGQQDLEQALMTNTTYQQLLTQGFNPHVQLPPTRAQPQATQGSRQYGIGPSQVTAVESSYEMKQTRMVAMQMQQGTFTLPSSHYGTLEESSELLRYQPAACTAHKRSHQFHSPYDYQALQQLEAHAGSSTQMPISFKLHDYYAQLHPLPFHIPSQPASPRQTYPQQSFLVVQPQMHHHHRLPTQCLPAKSRCTGELLPETDQYSVSSMVGQEGMPAPASKPKDPKLKFTTEDDALLIELKTIRNLTWKQISDFFPGRSPGTLQVRYCTKLKAKTTVWTDDMVGDDTGASAARADLAVDEYEADRWRIISDKVGNGFSAAAYREKAKSLVQPDVAVPSTKANKATETCRQTGTRE